MRIAVASDDLNVSTNVGRCTSYMCYTVDRGVITQCQNFPNPCLPPVSTAALLHNLGVDLLLSYSLDESVRRVLQEGGVEVVTGVTGTARGAVESYLAHWLLDGEALDSEGEAPEELG
ncbi:dinitrogenase iron-molybdenum cofactor biosynthesis protein [Eggerthellaceae bacterium zg-887]|uniref:NifB/NifX family molybdenum-iron cluster-binding protein n=1 Tax=Xiamenia xianingshaonis TaxID=2682776 RepID=UPI0013EDA31B|nr:NifB/NifX family molybdenum-iron cluster-binding protein [Xiamenia xianingshaonis]NGM17401.1 dinitrogenase iron-molybdenum cofactor biosynthesis protein [Eggerthellaceae bacterium zg-893]NHM15939.1 dinitrogenase iron-molybdenum cofactor biosynthesis protein [Xiamenia xianingshaonis]